MKKRRPLTGEDAVGRPFRLNAEIAEIAQPHFWQQPFWQLLLHGLQHGTGQHTVTGTCTQITLGTQRVTVQGTLRQTRLGTQIVLV